MANVEPLLLLERELQNMLQHCFFFPLSLLLLLKIFGRKLHGVLQLRVVGGELAYVLSAGRAS